MNKTDAYAQTKMDPKEIVEIFKKKFMVNSKDLLDIFRLTI